MHCRQGSPGCQCGPLAPGAYAQHTQAYNQLIETFGEDIRGSDGKMDLIRLGCKVFGKTPEMNKFTAIVWPKIGRIVEAEIAAIREKTPDAIVVVEGAFLFEAG